MCSFVHLIVDPCYVRTKINLKRINPINYTRQNQRKHKSLFRLFLILTTANHIQYSTTRSHSGARTDCSFTITLQQHDLKTSQYTHITITVQSNDYKKSICTLDISSPISLLALTNQGNQSSNFPPDIHIHKRSTKYPCCMRIQY